MTASIAVGRAPERAEEAVQTLVQHPRGRAGGRRQVPARALEQVLAGVLDARRLGAGEGVAADEALVRARRGRAAAWSSRRR